MSHEGEGDLSSSDNILAHSNIVLLASSGSNL